MGLLVNSMCCGNVNKSIDDADRSMDGWMFRCWRMGVVFISILFYVHTFQSGVERIYLILGSADSIWR